MYYICEYDFFSLKNFIDRLKIPPVMRPCFALSACCLDRHPALKINYRDRTETATLRSAKAPRVAPSGQSEPSSGETISEPQLFAPPSYSPPPAVLNGPRPVAPRRGEQSVLAGHGRFFWASLRDKGLEGVLADFQVSLPTDLILFFSFFFWSGGWRRGADSGAVSCGASWAARGLKATTRVAWSGDGSISQSRGLAPPSSPSSPGWGGGGFRRERVVQLRWSHSRPVRSWLRPGLAGPFEPTRAGYSAGGSPRTPELGLHGRTKASQTRLLDAKFENKANLEKPEGTSAG